MVVLKRREVEEMRKPCTTGSLTRAASAFGLGTINLGNTKVGLRAIFWVPEAVSSPLRGYQKLYKLNKVY